MKELDLPDGMKQAEGMRDFTIWPEVNGREPLELLAGQHRIRALEEWVKDAKLGEGELWWPCKFYDRGWATHAAQFWFSTFRQVLETLSSLPGDAASYVKPEDSMQMSGFLGHGRSELETREFFYPGMGSQKVAQSCRRRPNLLVKLDREPYWHSGKYTSTLFKADNCPFQMLSLSR
ncbi:hypothetical protein E4U32_005601 [Claviceps aff. humidiphila group G2b]|nr:hypothetical protein E4U32_005601 [Claviceps aff. humidiphila group G2b]